MPNDDPHHHTTTSLAWQFAHHHNNCWLQPTKVAPAAYIDSFKVLCSRDAMRLHCSTKTYHYPSESLFTGALFTPPSAIVSTNNGTGIYRCDRLEVAWPSECSIQWIGTGMAIMLTITWGQWQSSDHHYITLTTPVDPWGHPCPVNHAKKYAMHTSEDTTGRKRHAWITGLDIKQFGPLAQGASRFEKLLARGPVDLRSYWSTNSRHRQQLWQNRSHGKSCNSVHGLL